MCLSVKGDCTMDNDNTSDSMKAFLYASDGAKKFIDRSTQETYSELLSALRTLANLGYWDDPDSLVPKSLRNPAFGLGPMVPKGKPKMYYAGAPEHCDICERPFKKL